MKFDYKYIGNILIEFKKIFHLYLEFPNVPQRSPYVKDLLRKMLIIDEDKRIGWE